MTRFPSTIEPGSMENDPASRQIVEVHSRSGTHMSNDNHLQVPVVDMVPGPGKKKL